MTEGWFYIDLRCVQGIQSGIFGFRGFEEILKLVLQKCKKNHRSKFWNFEENLGFRDLKNSQNHNSGSTGGSMGAFRTALKDSKWPVWPPKRSIGVFFTALDDFLQVLVLSQVTGVSRYFFSVLLGSQFRSFLWNLKIFPKWDAYASSINLNPIFIN